MKYILLAFISIAFSILSYGQDDTLAKYSYCIWGLQMKPTPHSISGTGFFVRNNGKLLFVTANHVVSAWKENGKKDEDFPNQMTIWATNQDGTINYSQQILIDITNVKKYAPFPVGAVVPDIVSLEVFVPTDIVIYSLENYFSAYYPKDPESIVIFGYPGIANVKDGNNIINSSIKLKFTESPIYINYPTLDSNSIEHIDSINYLLEIDTATLKSDTLKGYSGSVVFINDKKTKKWMIMGIFSQVLNHQYLMFLKPEYIINALKTPYK